jgi:hypothetical protein
MKTTTRTARAATIALGIWLGLDADALAQFGGSKTPWHKNPYLKKKDKDQANGSESAGAPINVEGEIALGQKAAATLPADGSIATVKFYAPKGAILTLVLSCSGDLDDSEARVKFPFVVLSEPLAKSGKKFELREHEAKSTGMHSVSFVHRGNGEISFTLSTSVKYPKTFEPDLDFASGVAAKLEVPGIVGRKISEIWLIPSSPDTVASVLVTVRDASMSLLASHTADLVSIAKPKLPLARPVPIDANEVFTLTFDLGEDAPKDVWKTKIVFVNPPDATGTVKLEPKK